MHPSRLASGADSDADADVNVVCVGAEKTPAAMSVSIGSLRQPTFWHFRVGVSVSFHDCGPYAWTFTTKSRRTARVLREPAASHKSVMDGRYGRDGCAGGCGGAEGGGALREDGGTVLGCRCGRLDRYAR
jgi:hypothetical protein